MSESIFNVGPVRGEYPLGRFDHEAPTWFLGRYVKIGFPTGIRRHPLEYMWVKVQLIEQKGGPDGEINLIGVLNNDPILIDNLKDGDRIKTTVHAVVEVFS